MPLTQGAAMRKDTQSGKHVSLQHRHFAFIAATIAGILEPNARYETAYHFAIACRSTNPAFDHDRFMVACNAIKVAC